MSDKKLMFILQPFSFSSVFAITLFKGRAVELGIVFLLAFGFLYATQNLDIIRLDRSVAQFGSAYRLGRWGRRFESCHSDREPGGAVTSFRARMTKGPDPSTEGRSFARPNSPLGE